MNSVAPEFSIIVPAYNVERLIGACLDSVCSQRFTDFEIIVVDDGSTDGTARVVEGYASADSRIDFVRKPNGGQSSARNLALDRSRGEYLIFLDSDDRLAPNALSEIEEHLELTRYPDLVVFDYFESEHASDRMHLVKGGLDFQSAKNSPWNKCYRKELWSEEKFPEGFLYEDLAVVPVLVAKAKTKVYLPKALYYYTVNREGSVSSVNRAVRLDQLLIATDCCVDRLCELETTLSGHNAALFKGRWKRRFYTYQIAKPMLRRLKAVDDRDQRRALAIAFAGHLRGERRALLSEFLEETGLRGLLAYLAYAHGPLVLGDVLWRLPGKLKRTLL